MSRTYVRVALYCPNCDSREHGHYSIQTWELFRDGSFKPICTTCKTPIKVKRRL